MFSVVTLLTYIWIWVKVSYELFGLLKDATIFFKLMIKLFDACFLLLLFLDLLYFWLCSSDCFVYSISKEIIKIYLVFNLLVRLYVKKLQHVFCINIFFKNKIIKYYLDLIKYTLRIILFNIINFFNTYIYFLNMALLIKIKWLKRSILYLLI